MDFATSQVGLVILAYALFMGFGGWMGFKKSDSKWSLVTGVASFAVLVVSVFIREPWIAVGASALLSVVFFGRVSKTGKFMPLGMLLVISAVVFAYLLIQMLGKSS